VRTLRFARGCQGGGFVFVFVCCAGRANLWRLANDDGNVAHSILTLSCCNSTFRVLDIRSACMSLSTVQFTVFVEIIERSDDAEETCQIYIVIGVWSAVSASTMDVCWPLPLLPPLSSFRHHPSFHGTYSLIWAADAERHDLPEPSWLNVRIISYSVKSNKVTQ
jgi:hypothetical protein